MILVRIETITSPWPLTMAADDCRARLTKKLDPLTPPPPNKNFCKNQFCYRKEASLNFMLKTKIAPNDLPFLKHALVFW